MTGLDVLTQGIETVNWQVSSEWKMYFIIAIIFSVIIAYILFLITDYMKWTVKVHLILPVGNPYYAIYKNTDGSILRKMVVSVEEKEASARLYFKMIKHGVYKEYFQIKNSNFNRENYFEPYYFYRRIKRSPFDFKSIGLRLFMHSQKGFIPLSVQNPTMEVAPTTMNTVISAYVNTQKDIQEKYENDFWSKYGSAIVMGMVVIAIVISFVFMIKLQEISWKNANEQLGQILATWREVLAPKLE